MPGTHSPPSILPCSDSHFNGMPILNVAVMWRWLVFSITQMHLTYSSYLVGVETWNSELFRDFWSFEILNFVLWLLDFGFDTRESVLWTRDELQSYTALPHNLQEFKELCFFPLTSFPLPFRCVCFSFHPVFPPPFFSHSLSSSHPSFLFCLIYTEKSPIA